MSWQLFKSEAGVLTGIPHVSEFQYAQTMATAYNNLVLRHFDSLTGMGVVINSTPKVPALLQGLLSVCQMNLSHQSQVNWLQQIAPHIITFWTGAIIIGPLGQVTVTSPGTWSAIPFVQNTNFNILLTTFEATARLHLMTLTGIYVSTVVPGVTTPWSGALLQTFP